MSTLDDKFNLDDFVAPEPIGDPNLCDITALFAEEGPSDWRSDRDEPVVGVRLCLPYELINALLILIDVEERHRRSEDNSLTTLLSDIDDLSAGELALEESNAGSSLMVVVSISAR